MKRALISDVHSNLEALTAVLQDIREQAVDEVYCLGDIVGYGPNPRECVDLVRQLTLSVLGNHDQAAIFDPEGFNPVALQAIYWTRIQLDLGAGPNAVNDRWDFLGELPRSYNDGPRLFVHGSAREPTNEYVFPEDIYDSRKMDNLFGRIEQYCFQGHTHIPGVFTDTREFFSPDECDYHFRLNGQKLMVNVGSVGQPRDNDPRACYAILTDDAIIYRRIEYPFEQTIEKIRAEPQLDNMLGERLRSGR